MSKYLDCPFCGSDEIGLWYQGVRYGRIAFVKCDVCGAQTKAFSYYDRGEEVNSEDAGAKCAISAWNRRSRVKDTES